MRLYDEEPEATHWRPVPVAELVSAAVGNRPSARPAVLAIDGRSSSGKTTLAAAMQETSPRAATIHTDDVAWHHSVFGWDRLLREELLEPARAGRAVSYRPPAWEKRDRPGAIEIAAGIDLLIVEGVGSGRRELAEWLDGIVWVQADLDVTLARDRERIAAGEITQDAYDDWMRQERRFQADQRTWERADNVICGSPSRSLPTGHVLVGSYSRPS